MWLLDIVAFVFAWHPLVDGYIRLPGLDEQSAKYNLDSGYLEANENGTWQMFYLLAEARHVSQEDAPLLVWFAGGPGCSSLFDFFVVGPAVVYSNDTTTFFNPYNWAQNASLLFLESPIGVGFSYDTEANYTHADDRTTAEQNFRALYNFFKKHKEYANSTFFIGGGSYAGLYVPMLAQKIVEAIEKDQFPNPNLQVSSLANIVKDKFQGIAISNGYMNVKISMNTLVLWAAYHGRASPDDWEQVKERCRTDDAVDVDQYDFTKFMTTKNGIDFYADDSTCGKLIDPLIRSNIEGDEGFNVNNFYDDCYYDFSTSESMEMIDQTMKSAKNLGISAFMKMFSSGGSRLGFSCWADIILNKYLNTLQVIKALNVADEIINRVAFWNPCNQKIYDDYYMDINDTTPYFEFFLQKNRMKSFRVLTYNGDTDLACNYLGDQYFMRHIAQNNNMTKTLPHKPWIFEQFQRQGGYFHRYEGQNEHGSKLSIDVLTVKGAGHYAAFDRPGPTLQMINNFLFPTDGHLPNYSHF